MEKKRRAALVCAGPVSRGSLIRLPGLRHQLDLIKASSIPTASRAAAALRCGRPVNSYQDLNPADLILISVPEDLTDNIVSDLAGSNLKWSRKAVILYGSERNSTALSSLRKLGALTATMNWFPHPERFVAEGSPEALKQARILAGDCELLIIRSKHEYFKGVRGSSTDFYPLLAEVVRHFCRSGMTKAAAEKTAALLFADSARSWLRAGRRLLLRPARADFLREPGSEQQDEERRS